MEVATSLPIDPAAMLAWAGVFDHYVSGDPIRLESIKLVLKTNRHLVKFGPGRIISEAKVLLQFVRPEKEEPAEQPKKRGRPRKNQ